MRQPHDLQNPASGFSPASPPTGRLGEASPTEAPGTHSRPSTDRRTFWLYLLGLALFFGAIFVAGYLGLGDPMIRMP